MKGPWRVRIVRDVQSYEVMESLIAYSSDKTFVGVRRDHIKKQRIVVHILTGECGHIRVHKGLGAPRKFFSCSDCERGVPEIAITEPLGRFWIDPPLDEETTPNLPGPLTLMRKT